MLLLKATYLSIGLSLLVTGEPRLTWFKISKWFSHQLTIEQCFSSLETKFRGPKLVVHPERIC